MTALLRYVGITYWHDKFLKKFVFIILQENIDAIKVEIDMDSLTEEDPQLNWQNSKKEFTTQQSKFLTAFLTISKI
jgi:hypothetical protein